MFFQKVIINPAVIQRIRSFLFLSVTFNIHANTVSKTIIGIGRMCISHFFSRNQTVRSIIAVITYRLSISHLLYQISSLVIMVFHSVIATGLSEQCPRKIICISCCFLDTRLKICFFQAASVSQRIICILTEQLLITKYLFEMSRCIISIPVSFVILRIITAGTLIKVSSSIHVIAKLHLIQQTRRIITGHSDQISIIIMFI